MKLTQSIILLATALPFFVFAGEKENIVIAKEFQEGIYIKHEVDSTAAKYLAKNFVVHKNGKTLSKQEWLSETKDLLNNYNNLESKVQHIIANDDYVVVHVVAKRTPTSTEKEFAIIKKVDHGKFTESWIITNQTE